MAYDYFLAVPNRLKWCLYVNGHVDSIVRMSGTPKAALSLLIAAPSPACC